MDFDFSQLSQNWWDPDGPMRPLHDLTPIRGQFILENCSIRKNAIDFGCGAGILSEWLAENKIKTTGIDQAPELVATATRHAKLSNLEINYICGTDLKQCKQADLITCMEVLEHCEDPVAVINMLAKKLNKKGTICISTINNTWESYLKVILAAEHILQIVPKGTHKKSDFIKPSTIIRAAQNNGLELIKAAGIEYLPHSRTGKLTSSLSCNYILAFRKN